MIGKIAYLMTFLVTIVVVAEVASENDPAIDHRIPRPHDLVVGYRIPGDHLVVREQIFKKAVWNQYSRVEQTFNVSKYESITHVRAVAQMNISIGGYASLLKGGQGTNNLTLLFRSQKGQGLYFFVDVYAML